MPESIHGKYKIEVHENKTLNEFINISLEKSEKNFAYKTLYKTYTPKRTCPDYRDFRTGPYVFDKIKLNWLIFTEFDNKAQGEVLVGHGITCEIYWDETVEGLPPNGWSGATIECHKNNSKKIKTNTSIGLLIHISKNYRDKKVSTLIAEEMKKIAIKKKQLLIIPLRPSMRYEKKFCTMPFTEFCELRREDGLPTDLWLRQHEKIGAKRLKICSTSHQHTVPISSFYKLFGNQKVTKTGFYVVNIHGGWQNVYVNLEKDTVVINEGCVWVQHKTI